MTSLLGRTASALVCALLCLAAAQSAVSAERRHAVPAAEKQKIEALIAAVEKLDGAVFVRNGKAYPPATAAKFLRGKWSKHAAEISTAEEFIAVAATRSSTTGRLYLVRFAGGREVPAAEFLRSRLEALR
jgi:Tfp pilus assembly protein PilX